MICYIRAIQTAVWRHYQLNSLGSCFPVKLVWNQITPRKKMERCFPLLINAAVLALPTPPQSLIISWWEIQNGGGQQGPRLLVPLGLWVFEFSDEVPQETESTWIVRPISIIHKAKYWPHRGIWMLNKKILPSSDKHNMLLYILDVKHPHPSPLAWWDVFGF